MLFDLTDFLVFGLRGLSDLVSSAFLILELNCLGLCLFLLFRFFLRLILLDCLCLVAFPFFFIFITFEEDEFEFFFFGVKLLRGKTRIILKGKMMIFRKCLKRVNFSARFSSEKTSLLAHRGYGTSAPDNSLEGFKKAAHSPFLTGVELDVNKKT